MEYELTRYDEARNALAICASIDEVKDIQDKSEAMRLYAKMSENTELEIFAATIKLRAQVKLGEMIAVMGKATNQHFPLEGKSKKESLADVKISTSAANRYEQLAAVPEDVREKFIAQSTADNKAVSMPKVMAFASPPKEVKVPVPPKAVTIEIETEKEEMVTITKEAYEEMTEMIDSSLAEEQALADMLDAEPDDRLSVAAEQIKQLTEQARLLNCSLTAANNQNNELKRLLKARDRQIKKITDELTVFQIAALPL